MNIKIFIFAVCTLIVFFAASCGNADNTKGTDSGTTSAVEEKSSNADEKNVKDSAEKASEALSGDTSSKNSSDASVGSSSGVEKPEDSSSSHSADSNQHSTATKPQTSSSNSTSATDTKPAEDNGEHDNVVINFEDIL